MQMPKWMSKKWFWGLVAVKTALKIAIAVSLYHSSQAKATETTPPGPRDAQCTQYMGDVAPTGCSFFVPSARARTGHQAYLRTMDESIEFQYFAERRAPEQVYFRVLKHFRDRNGRFRADCVANQMPSGTARCGMNFDDYMHNWQFLTTDLNQTFISWMTGRGGQAMPAMPDANRRRDQDASYRVSIPAVTGMMVGLGVTLAAWKLRVVPRSGGMTVGVEGAAAAEVSNPTFFARSFNRFMSWVTRGRSVNGMGPFARLIRKGEPLNLNVGHVFIGMAFGGTVYQTLKTMINQSMNDRFQYEMWLGQWLPLSHMRINTPLGRTPDIALTGVHVGSDGTMVAVDQANAVVDQINTLNQESEAEEQAEATGTPATPVSQAQDTSNLVTEAPRPQATQAHPNIYKMPDMDLVEKSARAFFTPENQCLGAPMRCEVGFYEPDYTTSSEARNPDLDAPFQLPSR